MVNKVGSWKHFLIEKLKIDNEESRKTEALPVENMAS